VTVGSAGVARAEGSGTNPQSAPLLWCTATSSVSAGMGTGYAVAWVPAGASATIIDKDIQILPSTYVGSGRGEFVYTVTLSGSSGAQLYTHSALANPGVGIIPGLGPYAWVAAGSAPIGTWVNTTGASVPVSVKADANPTFAGADTTYTLEVDVTGGASDPAPACDGSRPVTVANGGVAPNSRMSLNQCTSGTKPISCATGDFWHTFSDLSVPGRGPALNLQRTYNAFSHGSDSMFGYGWSNSYGMTQTTDGSGNVTVAQENGSTITFAPNGSGGFTSPANVLASLVQNTDGTLTLTDSHGGMTHTFAAAGQLLSETDRNGVTTTLSYDAGNRLTTVTDAAGRTLTFGYGSNGRVASATDPAGRQVSYFYDASGNLVSATNVDGGIWAFTYDSSHQLLTMTDPRLGIVATNTYDSAGRVTAQSDALNRTTTLAYSGDPTTIAGSTTTITDPRGNITTQTYVQLQMQSITRAFGTPQAATTTYSYDPFTNNVASKTDPNTHTTSYTWDNRGNQTSSTDPLGRTTSTSWTALNEPLNVTDPAGHTTTFAYDTRGNPVAQNRPVNATTTQNQTFTYGDAAHPGDVTSITDPTGKTWTMVYDANGDLTRRTDPLGGATSYGYDNTGRRTSMVSPRGNAAGADPAAFTTAYTYDPAGALTKNTDPLGHATSYGYDADGNQTTVTDPLGHITTTMFDAESQPTKVTRADGTFLAYGYDADGNQTSQTNALTNTTTYAYDPLNQVSSTHDPLNRATTYGYDPAGQLTSKTDPALRTTTFAYDAAGQRTTLSYSDATTPNVTYTYTTLGQRATMADGTGTTTYTYDWLGRLTASTNGAGQATSYAYDLAGHLTTLTYPNTKAVTRSYDDAGRLHTVTDWLGHTTTLTPDLDSNPASVVSGNAVTATSTFDNADQLSTITDTAAGTTVASFGYTRNANGQLASTTPTGVTQGNESYPYTQLNQLAGVNTATYAYDAADNLTNLVNGTTQTFDAANQLTSATTAGATTSYTYDSLGNQAAIVPATGDHTSYAYDQAQHLSAVQKGKLYQPLTPARIADTDTGSGKPYAGQPIGPGGTLNVQATGMGGVPSTGISAVVVNVAQITDTSATYLTVFQTGITRPATSNVNAVAGGADATNEVTVPVGTNGQISIYNQAGTTNVIVDVLGYYSAGGAGMNAITPTRIADTRTGSGQPYAGQPIPARGTLTVQVSGTAGIPATATTAILEATVVTPTAGGYLTAYPAGITRPGISNLDYQVGVTLTKEIDADLGTSPSGAVTFYNSATVPVNLILDVAGYVNSVGDSLTPLTSARIADTRTGSGQNDAGKTMAANTALTIQAAGQGGVPANARSVVVNLTVPGNTTTGYLTAYPSGTHPATTNVTYSPGAIAFNQVTVKLSPTGTFTIWNAGGTADVIIDVMGSYGPLSSYTYNGDGLRATRTTTTGTQNFAWDPTGAVPLMLTDGAISYIYDDNGNPLEQVDTTGTVLYYQHDQYGSTRLLTTATGAVAATYSYDPYGNLTGHTGTADTPLRWNGQYQDTDTGLYYLRNRYYNPVTAQFLTRDPLEALTASAYSYADGNPLNAADPMGLCSSWYETAAWGVVNFFSYRSYINGAGYAAQGQYYHGAGVFMGEAPNAGTQAGLALGAHSIPIEGQGMVHLLGQGARLGSRALVWQVGVVATVLDYWHTPAVWNPATFLLNVITQDNPLNFGSGYDPTAPAGTG
jgi:RHS repeat-associated protein